MLATFVIGLREGLEAALIVGIIAAFLKKQGRSLLPMWWGVLAGLGLSAVVGVALKIVESSLDQGAQEAMETVIGAVAVVFATGMALWMMTNARGMKKQLEGAARSALGEGSSRALALMAFLAVLKEGFETSVFLLATFQASTNAGLAAAGAVLGVVVAAIIGYGIYTGGVSLNLGTFFKFTSVFLVLVAAGLVLRALHTAHGAGWINAGQGRTVDLAWLAPYGSVQSALLTGVLGIPADPRVLEVIGWFAYLVPMLLLILWPAKHRPSARQGARLKLGLASLFVVAGVVLALAVPAPVIDAPTSAPLVAADGSTVGTGRVSGGAVELTTGSTTTRVSLAGATVETHDGVPAQHVTRPGTVSATDLPATIDATQLATLNGGRFPVGLDPRRYPGPYTATWTRTSTVDVWVVEGVLLDAASRDTVAVTVTGGGLTTPRTIGVASGTALPDGSTPLTYAAAPTHVDTVASAVSTLTGARDEASLWRRLLPGALVVAAVLLALSAALTLRRERISRSAPPSTPTPSSGTTPPSSAAPAATPGAAAVPTPPRSTADAR